MDIDHVHFYVEDAERLRDWFIDTLGFESLVGSSRRHTRTEVVGNGAIHFILSSPLADHSPVAAHLRSYSPGVVDLAFRVSAIEAVVEQAVAQGARVLQPVQVKQQVQGSLKQAQISGWSHLRHTLVERTGENFTLLQGASARESELLVVPVWRGSAENNADVAFTGIDHVVLNVAAGDLPPAIAWYENTLGFQRQQAFAIRTERSALCSQVLVHPQGAVQLPINEPASASSQIQEFLDANRGPGVQHIALQTVNVVEAIARLRQRGLPFLQVPATYYSQLKQRPGFQLSEVEWQAIADQEVLVDWQEDAPQAMLLQAFTQPIFDQPTFFFELIERQTYNVNHQCRQAQGFGEGNFRALFEAIEREQMKRGSLH